MPHKIFPFLFSSLTFNSEMIRQVIKKIYSAQKQNGAENKYDLFAPARYNIYNVNES